MKTRPLIFAACGLLMASLPAQEATDIKKSDSSLGEHAKDVPVPIVCEVVSSAGKPVVDARVYLSCPSSRDFVPDIPLAAEGKTDAEGMFRTTVDRPRHWQLFSAFAVVDAGKDGIGLGHVYHHPMLHTPEKHLIEVLPTSELKATILTPDGKPAAGLEVWLHAFALQKKTQGPEPGLFGEVNRLPGELWKARTDAQGKFVMPMLPKGANVYLRHDDARWAQFKGRYNILAEPLAKVDGTEPTLQLAEPGSIRGRILLPDGKPVPGSIVSIIEGIIPYVTAYGHEVKTNERGEFTIPQIPPSTYKVHYDTQPPYFARWIGAEKTNIVVTAGQTTDMGDLVVTEAAQVIGEVVDAETGKVIEEPLTFRLAPGQHDLHYRSQRYPKPEYHPPGSDDSIPVQVKGGEQKKVTFKLSRVKPEELVTGVVLDEAGKPAEKVRLGMMGYGDLPFPLQGMTDKDGKFKMMRERGATQEMVLAWTDTAMSDPVAVESGKPITVQLREKSLGKIQGTVVDEAGKPIAGAKIRWSVPESVCMQGPVPQQTKSDAEGRFEFPRFWSRKEGVNFSCQAEGVGDAAIRGQEVLSGTVTELKFVMRKADKAVSGVLVDTTGKPVVGMVVRGGGSGQPGDLKSITDSQGRFRIAGLAPGRVHLRVIVRTEEFTSEAAKWASTGNTDVKLTLPAADGEVSGTVVDASGKPVPMAKVESYGRGRKTSTDDAGRFQLSGVVKGWFTVRTEARNADGEKVEMEVRLKTGMKDVKIALPAKNREEVARSAEPLDLIGKPAPQVEYTKWVNCEPLAPHGKGKVRILDFWGIECAPCIASFPKVQKFWEAHKDKGIEIVATTSFYPEQEVKEFLAKNPTYNFPVALRDESSSAGRDYDVRGIPTYVVIDAFGKIASKGHDFDEAAKVALELVGK